MEKISGIATTYAANPMGEAVDLQKIYDLLKDLLPQPVLYFTPLATEILHGPFVDMMLRLKPDEKGFIVPESLRGEIRKAMGRKA